MTVRSRLDVEHLGWIDRVVRHYGVRRCRGHLYRARSHAGETEVVMVPNPDRWRWAAVDPRDGWRVPMTIVLERVGSSYREALSTMRLDSTRRGIPRAERN